MEWQPIEMAPKDGRPIWVRWHPWGDKSQTPAAGWAYWDGSVWHEAGTQSSWLIYAIEFLPLQYELHR